MIMILHVFLQTRHIEKISTGWVNLSPFWAETIQSFPNQIWILNWWIQFYSQHSRSRFGLHDSLGGIGAENPGANCSSVKSFLKNLFFWTNALKGVLQFHGECLHGSPMDETPTGTRWTLRDLGQLPHREQHCWTEGEDDEQLPFRV